MKKSILTIAIALSAVIGFSSSSFAATRNNEESTTLTETSAISKIEIHGNVEVFLSNGETDKVKVYNRYYSESALVQDQNGVLRIASYGSQKLVVWVTVSNLSKVSVYDNAQVKSFGKLSAIDLNVNLYNNASAQIDLDGYSAVIGLHDHAKADLSGKIETGALYYDQSSTLNTTNLAIANLVKEVRFTERIKSAELASL